MKTDKYLFDMFPELKKYVPIQENLNIGVDVKKIRPMSRQKIFFYTETGVLFQKMVFEITNMLKNHNCYDLSFLKKVIPGYNDIFSKYPDLKQYWSERNIHEGIDPLSITCQSSRKAYFKCQCCGNEIPHMKNVASFVNGSRTCPKCGKRFRTSLSEQCIYFYVKRVYNDAVNQFKDIFKNGSELDVYIPSIHLGIEYDGSKWHKSIKLKKDNEKYEICKKNGITLFRICENKKHANADICLIVEKKNTTDKIKTILKYIPGCSGIDVDITRDYEEILEDYISACRDNSFGKVCPEYVKYWSRDNKLSPYQVKLTETHQFKFTCEKHGEFYAMPRTFYLINMGMCKKSQYSVTPGCHECHSESMKKSYGKSVIAYFICEKRTEEYVSGQECARQLGINPKMIPDALNDNFFIDNGRLMLFRKDDFLKIQDINVFIKNKRFHRKYTFNEICNLVLKYGSFSEFFECEHSAYLFARRRNWLEYLPYYQSKKRPVVKLNEKYEIIAKYESKKDASIENKMNQIQMDYRLDKSFKIRDGIAFAYADEVLYFF